MTDRPGQASDNWAHRDATVRIQGLCHYFGESESRKQVLFDIDLELFGGQIVLLTGPSGSGKTTLLTLIGALRSVQEGTLEVLGNEYSGMADADSVLSRRDIGFIFQGHNLFASLTALRNVRLSFELQGYPRDQLDRLAADMLRRVGLGDRLHYKPAKLSGGQRQRVAVARALGARPKLVLADEPTAALDGASGRKVMALLQELAYEEGATLLIVTHDNRILDAADRVVNMIDGRIVSDVHVKQSLEVCDFLVKCDAFENMTPEVLTELSQATRLERFESGTRIIRQGDEGDKFYVVRRGNALVSIQEGGEVVTEVTISPGDYFGEVSLLTGAPRNASVFAQGPVELFSLDARSFRGALDRSHSFAEQLRAAMFARTG